MFNKLNRPITGRMARRTSLRTTAAILTVVFLVIWYLTYRALGAHDATILSLVLVVAFGAALLVGEYRVRNPLRLAAFKKHRDVTTESGRAQSEE